jgi:hypothetical protein
VIWLKAPAAAEASRTLAPSSATFQPGTAGPGVAASPATPVSAIATPILSFNTDTRSETRVDMTIAPRPVVQRSGQTWARYFQFT